MVRGVLLVAPADLDRQRRRLPGRPAGAGCDRLSLGPLVARGGGGHERPGRGAVRPGHHHDDLLSRQQSGVPDRRRLSGAGGLDRDLALPPLAPGPLGRRDHGPILVGKLAWVPAFFGLRIVSALCLLKLSASFLPVSGFTVFSQLMLFASLLGVLALGGAQNGVIRQAAAAKDLDELMRTQSAAFTIWLAAAPVALLPALLGGKLISNILVGSPNQWPTVLAIAGIVLLGAPSGIWCALLTGRKRVAQSLSAQGAGLVAGALGAAWRITAPAAAGPALAFAAGPVVTTCVATPLALRLRVPRTAPRWCSAPG